MLHKSENIELGCCNDGVLVKVHEEAQNKHVTWMNGSGNSDSRMQHNEIIKKAKR